MEYLRNTVRKLMARFAKLLDSVSKGKITPNQVTFASLALHVPIALAIVNEMYVASAIMIIFFGLLDTVDGELARLQKRASKTGMLLDASTDRMKESLIFIAISYGFALDGNSLGVLAAVSAITGSVAVSYIKAKGETVMVRSRLSMHEINHVFKAGFMRYEIRMAALVIGLLVDQLLPAVVLIAIMAWLTAIYRLVVISNRIDNK